MSKRLGILTSGGDCAGLNAVLRAVTLRATQTYGWTVYGIKQGTRGLMMKPESYQILVPQVFDGSLFRQGGTILGTTNKGDPFAYPMPDGTFKDLSSDFALGCKNLKLDGLIGIGGDGSINILKRLTDIAKIPFIAIPKTIDNDVSFTENAIGFSTAVEVATEALDRLMPTAASHDRVMILEVMGRDAGHIALTAGIAGGADVILIPEIPYSLENVARKIKDVMESGRNYATVVVSEAVKDESGKKVTIVGPDGRSRYGGIGHYLSDRIQEMTGAETRFMVLGHVQRGGQPDWTDRVLASAFGVQAVDLIAEGKSGLMVAWQERKVVTVPLADAIATPHVVKTTDTLVQTAKGLSICLG